MLVDKDYFRYLFEQYYNPLCNYVANTFGISDEAEDIVMDVFAHLWSKHEDMEELRHPKTYLFKSVYHKAIEKIRAKKMEILTLEAEKIVVVDYKEEIADEFVLKEKIYQSIRQLPSQCQLIFVKAKIDGMSYKEIAQDLQLSVKTVENQMTKALRIIRVILKDNH